MLPAIRKVRWGLLVAALAGGLTVASAAPAMAAEKLVTSDKVSFKGVLNAAGTEWTATRCTLTSDGELVPGTTKLEVIPCQLRGQAKKIAAEEVEIFSSWESGDGTGSFENLIVKHTGGTPPVEIYAGEGPGVEEETENGILFYPAVVKVKLSVNPAKHTIAGTYLVKEGINQP